MYIKTTKPYTFVDPKTKEQVFVSPNTDTAVPDWIQGDIVYDRALKDKTLQIVPSPKLQSGSSKIVSESPVTTVSNNNEQSDENKEETAPIGNGSNKS
ncbi:hypothetical protein AB840_11265 [Megasphaera cerevisiae DSM 20462]|uniref:Uncharacterized protein n=1 Tax=Megasphaera cerevisiae DSM 20462 TaxID=1122219 RepID=A0A0J6WVK5_9FIRM|nr:hypothetical protein [Megasphaera cerevisiae]KMO85847.1 hypothetical protein AB840_11265 [Megasphaera cerevisiae DSM 20462]SJZ58763.1 hypothetical protein SAMN05660900_00857 [Megasphaera cerevisiae DSM 20462]